jgi:hypothetical protein
LRQEPSAIASPPAGDAGSRRPEPDGALVKANSQSGSACGLVEGRRGLAAIDVDAIVRPKQLTERLSQGPPVLGVALTCVRGPVHETMVGEPADKPPPVLEIVPAILEICSVDELADQLQIFHNLC